MYFTTSLAVTILASTMVHAIPAAPSPADGERSRPECHQSQVWDSIFQRCECPQGTTFAGGGCQPAQTSNQQLKSRQADPAPLIPKPRCIQNQQPFCARSADNFFPYNEDKASSSQIQVCVDDGVDHAFCAEPATVGDFLKKNWGVWGLFSGVY